MRSTLQPQDNVLEALTLCFTLPTALHNQIEQYLETLADETQLERLFAAAI